VVSAVAKIVEATFSVGEETAEGGAHAVAIGAFNNVRCGREGSSAYRVVFRTGPEAEDDEIRLSGLPPEWVSNVLLRNPENRRDGRFRISDFGMREGIWGGTWFSRRVDNKVGIVAEITKSFCQKAEVAVPEKLVRADGEVGVEKDFHESAGKKDSPPLSTHKSFLGNRWRSYFFPVNLPFGIGF